MILAKIPIPFIIYPYPAAWAFLLIATLIIGGLVVRFSGGPVEPTVSVPAVLFIYSGYHMIGGMFNGFDPFFGLGLLGTVASGTFGFFMFSRMVSDHREFEASAPERERQMREDGVNSVIQALGIERAQAEQLMDRYGNDDTKIILEARAGRLDTGSQKAPAEVTVSSSSSTEVTKISGPPFDSVNGYALLQASPGEKDYSRWSKMLASVCDLLALDAMQKMRAHRGAVIITDLKGEIADAFMKLLEQEGVRVIKIPVEQMMKFASGGQVKAFEFGEGTLKIINHSEQVLEAPLESLLLLTVGVFGATQVTGPDGMVEAGRGHIGADLFVVVEDNRCLQFMLDRSRLSYAHLGERMAESGVANFRLTVADLIERLPGLNTNDSARAFAEQGRARNFRNAEDYAGEVTGLAQLIRATQMLSAP